MFLFCACLNTEVLGLKALRKYFKHVCAFVMLESDQLSKRFFFSSGRLEGCTKHDLNYFGSNVNPRTFSCFHLVSLNKRKIPGCD